MKNKGVTVADTLMNGDRRNCPVKAVYFVLRVDLPTLSVGPSSLSVNRFGCLACLQRNVAALVLGCVSSPKAISEAEDERILLTALISCLLYY